MRTLVSMRICVDVRALAILENAPLATSIVLVISESDVPSSAIGYPK